MMHYKYNWMGMHKDVEEYVKKFPTCARAEDER